MIVASKALSAIPAGLRDPLLDEYRTIVQNFLEQRWLPSELSGGRLSEIVYTILDGHAKKSYAAVPSKPSNFPDACRKLESNTLPHVPHSFQILIPQRCPLSTTCETIAALARWWGCQSKPHGFGCRSFHVELDYGRSCKSFS